MRGVRDRRLLEVRTGSAGAVTNVVNISKTYDVVRKGPFKSYLQFVVLLVSAFPEPSLSW